MKKCLCSLLLLCIVLSGCSSNSAPFKRKHQSRNDVIKFHNIEWLTPFDKVEQVFKNEYGADSFVYYARYPATIWGFTAHSDTVRSNRVILEKKSDREPFFWERSILPLYWVIFGEEVHHIFLDYIQTPYFPFQTGEDSSKMYLCGGTYLYEEVARDSAKAIKSRLDELYGDGIQRDPCYVEMDYIYTDENMNTVELTYYVPDDANPDSGKLTIEYQCGDVFQYFDQVRKQ